MVIESTIDPAVTSFDVTGLKPSRRYQYQLQAQNAIGTSEMSDPSDMVHLPEEREALSLNLFPFLLLKRYWVRV